MEAVAANSNNVGAQQQLLQQALLLQQYEMAQLQQQQQQQQQSRPAPPQIVRVGFATAGSSLFLSDGEDNVCFDSEGSYVHGKVKKRVAQRFGRDQVVGVLLNLDSASPNAHTVSLFRDGVRVAEPQPLPDCLKGKVLFPAISYKGTSLRVNFAAPPMKDLPFKCLMLQDAAAADCEVAAPAVPQDGKYEVVFPVGLPDEGTFDAVDQFLMKHPAHVELSSRAVIEWATKSGCVRKTLGTKGCNDRPETGFGLAQLDDMSVLRMLTSMAPALPRNFVVAEVKGNLTAETRKAVMARFPGFKKTAIISMGEPSEEHKQGVQASLLKEKRAKAEAEAKKKKAELERKKLLEAKRQKAKAAATGETAEKAEAEAPAGAAEESVEEPPVELTEEEKKVVFRKRPLPDLVATDLAKSFTKFSLPEAGDGFDDLRFEWQPATACSEYLREWMLKRKVTQRVEDIQPSKWFKDKLGEWQKSVQDWKKKQSEWKKVLDQLQEWKKEGKKKGTDEEKKDTDEKLTELDADDLDVFAVENISDIGSGEPLFANFEYEDWCLLALRYELHLLVHAFRRDMDDPERTTFHESHLAFYYNRYFKKALDVKMYSASSNSEAMELIKDTMTINSTNSMLEGQLPEDSPMDHMVKLAEENRRDRQRRLDAGDESAELKFKRPVTTQVPRQPGQWQKAPQQNWQKAPQQAAQKTQFQPAQRTTTQLPRYTPVSNTARTPAQGGAAPRAQYQAAPRAANFQAAPKAAASGTQAPKSQYQAAPRAVPAQQTQGTAQKRPFTPAPKANTQQPALKQARTAYTANRGW
mmetsp:Transcript_114697/g.370635  ORF Transcript_114697/g.370635 Transcript_114697/m.370635 type:complete len:807 (+) Transcript_114697:76-2496(+)